MSPPTNNHEKWLKNNREQCKWVVYYLNKNTEMFGFSYTGAGYKYGAVKDKITLMEKSEEGRKTLEKMRNAWRQHLYTERQKKKGIKNQSYALSTKAKTRLKLIAKRETPVITINEAIELLIEREYTNRKDLEERYKAKYKKQVERLEAKYTKKFHEFEDANNDLPERLKKLTEDSRRLEVFYSNKIFDLTNELALLRYKTLEPNKEKASLHRSALSAVIELREELLEAIKQEKANYPRD